MTAGESHGKALMGILQGLPSNLKINFGLIDSELSRRQQGYGRGGRMAIETDKAQFLAGIRGGVTTGAPIGFVVENADHKNWSDVIGANATKLGERTLTAVRPGHADLAGCIKYEQSDARNILERASARSTATTVTIGALCRQYLSALGISISSSVLSIGGAISDKDKNTKIDEAKKAGDTLGGEISLRVSGVPIGFGSHISADSRLEFSLASHLMALNTIKSVSIGNADGYKVKTGVQMHDKVFIDNVGKVYRNTNNAGGIEGGISNGEDILISLITKPIPTVMCGLNTIDIATKKPTTSATERSDICAVEAVAVVAESVLAYALAEVVVENLGGDTIDEHLERMAKKRAKGVL